MLVTTVLKGVRLCRLQSKSKTFFHLLLEPLRAKVLHSVLHPSMLATGAVTKVPCNSQNAFAHIFGITRSAKANDISQPGVRFLVVVGESETTTHGHIETHQLVVLNDGNETSTVSEKVHIIAGWNGHCDFELARQVGQAIQWLLLHRRGSHDLDLLGHLVPLHQEDLVVGPGAWQAMVMDVIGVVQNLIVQFLAANIRAGCAQHIAAHITTCSQCVHAGFVHGSHGVLHISLQDSMHLPSLACGNLQGAVGEVLANVVHGNPLLSCAKATGQADTNHEAEGILDTHLLTLLAQIAVVLLVRSMGLDQFGILEGDLPRCDVIQGFLHASSELFSLHLDLLIGLHRAIITASTCICLVNTKAREELALPLSKSCVVLVHVLVISKSCGHHALGPHLFQEVV
eukprot:Skav214897  [mRNA]  locus=scaffold1561:86645:88001:+ [translate_table: standard]